MPDAVSRASAGQRLVRGPRLLDGPPREEEEVDWVLRPLDSAWRREAGGITCYAHRSVDDPAEHPIYEPYIEEDAFHRHVESEHLQALVLEDAVPMLTRLRQCVLNLHKTISENGVNACRNGR